MGPNDFGFEQQNINITNNMEILNSSFSDLLVIMFLVGLVVFVSLYFVDAGYGKMRTEKWGPSMNNKAGWLLMECPVFFVVLYEYFKALRNPCVFITCDAEDASESEITVNMTSRNDKVFISVADSGIGIPKESLSKIWDRFYKTDLSRGKDKTGRGKRTWTVISCCWAAGN